MDGVPEPAGGWCRFDHTSVTLGCNSRYGSCQG